MKLLLITGLLLLSVSRGCVDDKDEDWETETGTVGYDAADATVRNAIADWNQFLVESDTVVYDACVRISQATDKVENTKVEHKGRLRSAIIQSEERMEKLSNMLLKARKIQPHNFKFDDGTLDEIASFKKDFKNHQEKLDNALEKMDLLTKE